MSKPSGGNQPIFDAYGRSVHLADVDYHTEEEKDLRPALHHRDVRIVTQNLRGFREQDRWEWMSAWRNIPLSRRPTVILLQETHVTTNAERQELTRRWQWMWGVSGEHLELSYWSVAPHTDGGVGVLIFPEYAGQVKPWNRHLWTARSIGIQLKDMHLLNVYAPVRKKQREPFFDGLAHWQLQNVEYPLLAGDFNCVETPHLDRLGGSRSERSESEALTRLIRSAHLEDARILLGSALDELELAPHEHFTHWQGKAASRIGRIYVPISRSNWVQWLDVQLPPMPSDHDEVMLHLRAPGTGKPKSSSHRSRYPIRGGHAQRLVEELLIELAGHAPQHGIGRLGWDQWVQACHRAVKKIAKRDKKRRNKRAARLQRQLRENGQTRAKLLSALVEDLKERSLACVGKRLERTPDQVRWLFKRTAIWERDQSVTRILPPDNMDFAAELPIPERFAQVWATVMGKRHSKLNADEMKSAVAQFADIPADRRVRPEDNEMLMAKITEEDLYDAIKALERHKAAGEDGLGNDFYCDVPQMMVPRLVEVCNELMQGNKPPESFLKAIVVPLRKKGDSPNALDYRPISLLQTSYKLFAKVLATRLQRFIGRLIGNTQQGFIHGRQMNRSVIMMLAKLESAICDALLSGAESAGVLLLDFAKAYDTVDRLYMLEVLRNFGFAPEFVHLVEQLHANTSAQFFVNGELSGSFEVKSGIRQGCPLAPLLFILAAELLGLALAQDATLEGIPVPGSDPTKRHQFSAFVDDSTLFFQKSRQVPRALAIVEKFGSISGLRMQPNKSKYIFLNTAVHCAEWHGVPVLAPGAMVRYLGYEVGLGDMHQYNWAKRMRCVKRRMATCHELLQELVSILMSLSLFRGTMREITKLPV